VQRKWAVRPDETGTVSREALYQAFADAAAGLTWRWLPGGRRRPGAHGVPGEMVMTGALLCWKDRTDAKPQAEVAQAVVPEPPVERVEPPKVVTRDGRGRSRSRPRPASACPPPRPDGDLIDDPLDYDPADGFDYTKLEAEDIENEPAAH
jgi:hypothetical protein